MRDKPIILVVDDNPINLRVLVKNLQAEYDLLVSKNGNSALKNALKHLPDIILLDIMLPDMDGFSVCEALQQDEKTSSIPIIFISSVHDPVQKTRAFAAGGVDYVTKPFHQAEVMARVQTHLQLKTMREVLEQQKEVVSQQLTEKNRQLSTLMDNLFGIAYRSNTDAERTMQLMSVGTTPLTGYSVEHFTHSSGTSFMSVVLEKDRAELSRRIEEALSRKERFECEYRIVLKNGEHKWVREQGVGLYNDAGVAYAVEGFISDATKSKTQELGIRKENSALKKKMQAHYLENIVGDSEPMQNLYEMILKAAGTDDNVIVYGESGTGKELVSRAVHDHSTRINGNFVPVNCGAIPEHLFESEFFGHKKGAFTGAVANRRGYLEQADGGTLFLDELGEISQLGQIKLLRAIEGGGFTPVGGTGVVHVKPRIVAATNRDLMEMVTAGAMRSDFYYRIHVVPIYIPPLRDRKQDIPQLIEHFMRMFPKLDECSPITPEVMNAFVTYDWPGNIRELQNALHQYLHLGTLVLGGEQIISGCSSTRKDCIPQEPLEKALARFERQYIVDVLKHNAWRRMTTANTLQIDRKTLFRKMKQYDIVEG
ncbi:RNA polymerase subunit sigma-54 [Halodesulfovibrio spirochaetisodalis]|uniref:RNA polymerase subunit sigma-54 n=2 Tax=Halodesulfovibrio spirochaetisodalis TaxID=1560234 RepID=A0A1B7XMS6_9BACT|nr:RNA polymerase subunit sigma-54 [Halodesulfovibrio spirochaetisodalis]